MAIRLCRIQQTQRSSAKLMISWKFKKIKSAFMYE